MTKILEFVKRHKRAAIFILVPFIIIVAVIVFILFFGRGESPVSTKPPVVSVNRLEVLSASPQGEVQTLSRLFPVSVKFNEDLGGSTSGILVAIVPNVPFETYVISSQPSTLWIKPSVKSTNATGWVDKTEYTVSIKKGSETSDGAILKEDFSFSFVNRTEGISMFAN